MKNWLTWALIQGSNGCNILVGILLAHALSPSDFGRFATMAAFLALFAALLNPLINELAHCLSGFSGLSISALGKRSVLATLAGVLLSVATCFSMTDTWAERVVILIVLPFALVSWSWMTGVLIGRNNMALLARSQCVGALLRLLFVSTTLSLAPTLLNVALAYVISFFTMTLCALPSTRGLRPSEESMWTTNWGLVFGFFLLAAPFSIDQPLIQLWFPEASGNYAAIMTYAKSIMILSSPALTIAYSSTLQHRETRLSPMTITKLSAVVICLAGFFWLLRSSLFPLLLGPQYVELQSQVGYALLAISFHVIVYAVAQVQLISGSPWLVAALALPPIAQTLYLKTLSTPSITTLCCLSLVVFTIQLVVVLTATTFLSRERNP